MVVWLAGIAEHQPHQRVCSLYSTTEEIWEWSEHTHKHTHKHTLSLAACVKRVHSKERQNITLAQLRTHRLRSNGSLEFTLAISKKEKAHKWLYIQFFQCLNMKKSQFSMTWYSPPQTICLWFQARKGLYFGFVYSMFKLTYHRNSNCLICCKKYNAISWKEHGSVNQLLNRWGFISKHFITVMDKWNKAVKRSAIRPVKIINFVGR